MGAYADRRFRCVDGWEFGPMIWASPSADRAPANSEPRLTRGVGGNVLVFKMERD
jgi:hypothetical protein